MLSVHHVQAAVRHLTYMEQTVLMHVHLDCTMTQDSAVVSTVIVPVLHVWTLLQSASPVTTALRYTTTDASQVAQMALMMTATNVNHARLLVQPA